MAPTAEEELFLTPLKTPICLLDAKEAFEGLSGRPPDPASPIHSTPNPDLALLENDWSGSDRTGWCGGEQEMSVWIPQCRLLGSSLVWRHCFG